MEDRWLVCCCKRGSRDALRRVYEKYKQRGGEFFYFIEIFEAGALSGGLFLGDAFLRITFVVWSVYRSFGPIGGF